MQTGEKKPVLFPIRKLFDFSEDLLGSYVYFPNSVLHEVAAGILEFPLDN
jgi:hypothetical protein